MSNDEDFCSIDEPLNYDIIMSKLREILTEDELADILKERLADYLNGKDLGLL